MPKATVFDMQGSAVGEIELSEAIFASDVNVAAMHLVVRNQLGNRRQGTQSTLTRTEVRGGGRKMYRQKGTGNARHHSRRAPQFTHGGVVFAPKPRDYGFSIPHKVRRLAMKGALTSKVSEGDIIVLDGISLEAPKTRYIAQMLKALGADRKALLVLPARDEDVLRASGNIEGLKTAYVNTLNVLDILGHDKFIILKDAITQVEEVYV